MKHSDDVVVVTPPVDVLVDVVNHDDLTCPVKQCGKKMRNASSLRLHVVKSHGIGVLKRQECNGKSVVYACPIAGCPRHATSKRQQFFRILYRLKLHYQNVHAEKKFKCNKCPKMFGSFENKEKHEGKCMLLFYCMCGTFYTTRNAVLTHAKRKGNGHCLVEVGDDKETKPKPSRSENVVSSQNVVVPAILYFPSSSIFASQNIPNIVTKGKSFNNEIKIDLKSVGLESLSSGFSSEQTASLLESSLSDVTRNNDECQKCCPVSIHQKFSNRLKLDTLPKISRFEKRMLYLSSHEAKEALADPYLLQMALSKTQCAPHQVHKKNQSKMLNQKSRPCMDSYNELGCSASSLAKSCTEINVDLHSIDTDSESVAVNQNLNKSTLQRENQHAILSEVDFSIAADGQTQTENFFSWLDGFPSNCTSETQTNLTNNIDYPEPLLMDKSVQLDEFLFCENLSGHCFPTDCSNIGTQTHLNEVWLNNEINEALLSEQNTSSTQTDIDFELFNMGLFSDKKKQTLYLNVDDLSSSTTSTFGTQTAIVEQEMNSSGTQTFNHVDFMFDVHGGMKSMETQTATTFYDTLDTSLLDDYLQNNDFETTSTVQS